MGTSKPREETHQQGIGPIVKHNETGVYGGSLIRPVIDHDRVGVAADIVVLFEEGDLVTALQQVGRRNPGNPAADHGDL